ncbi:hypothetical protein [Arthrobacter globiformis]|uniref:hypothetical protein n=1 Tax=Arthrobacter globiformis TaxID=1665 RepID=UPI002787F4C9|nr:hypothetical protein [Arthrobacter globiformis]MDQ0864551.1 hypothetical protein [Arthrobacter globiformis]
MKHILLSYCEYGASITSTAHIHARLKDAVTDGQLPSETNLLALADALNAILDGMALRSRDGIGIERLRKMGRAGERMLPTEMG